MTRGPAGDEFDDDVDDEALRWAGDDERGMVAPRRRGRLDADGADADAGAAAAGTDAVLARRPGRTAALVLFGILYAVITIGWVLAVQRLASGSADLFTEVTWQFGEFMAMLAAALWFGVVVTTLRERATGALVVWLAVGAIVLVPWPSVIALAGALS